MTPPLLGILGKKRAGKDTFAARLVEAHGWTRVAFADPLKEMALAADPLVGPAPIPGDLSYGYRRLSDVIEAIGWEQAKDHVPEVRRTLQRLGQAVRNADEGFWVRIAMAEAHRLRFGAPATQRPPVVGANRPRPVVVTDVRLTNEAEAIVAAGGRLVRIVRDGSDIRDLDRSETELDEYVVDYTVNNGGSLDDLNAHADTLAALLGPDAASRNVESVMLHR